MADYRWMAMVGKFEFPAKRVVFHGPRGVNLERVPASAGGMEVTSTQGAKEEKSLPGLGVALCNQQMVTGSVAASFEFEDLDPICVGHILLSYDPVSKAQLSAGLGWGPSMFSVVEWLPPISLPEGASSGVGASGSSAAVATPASGSWVVRASSGDRGNLHPGTRYQVVVDVRGSSLNIDVDGIRVLSAVVPALSSHARQLGVFCFAKGDVTITDFSADVLRPQAFVVMQFSVPYNDVYSEVIKNVCDVLDVDAVRGDEIYGPGIIIKDVIDRISRSQVVIADVSPSNPNVYFEVGYALALGKPIILLAQRRGSDSPLPFDISSFRVLFYDDSIGGKVRLESGLRNHLREILGRV